MNKIAYLKHKDIDYVLWNRCIEQAANGLIFGTSWFLDSVCEHWDALVLGNYEAVMPLPWKTKYGLHYLIQPNYTKQLGIFGDFTPHIEKQFIRRIPLKFLYAEFAGNEAMHHSYYAQRITQVINLTETPNYNKSTKKNIRRALNHDLVWTKGTFDEYYTAYKNLGKHYINQAKLNVIARFKENDIIQKHSTFSKVSDQQGNLHSIIWILTYNQRAYKISSATTEAGKKTKASFLALEQYLVNRPNHLTEFDFMGSELPGVYEYNKGFGASERTFPVVKMNALNRFLP